MHGDMAGTKLEVERLQVQAAEAVQTSRVSVLSIDVVQGTEKARLDQVVKDLNKLEAVVRRFDTQELQSELGKVDEMLGKIASMEGKWHGKGGAVAKTEAGTAGSPRDTYP